jgi:flagellin
MALAIATNTGALMAAASATSVNKDMETSMERLSTGKRINSAADDAAGVAIASRMTSEINGLNQAIRNAADGQGLAATAEGAMVEVENMLQRMRELAVQSSSGTLNDNDRVSLNEEVNQLKAEIDRVATSTRFNGVALLDGSADINLQIGANAGEKMNFKIGNMDTTALGTTLSGMASSAAVSNTAQGVEATKSIAQMAFNGNDSYGFTLTLGDGAGGTDVLTIAAASVVGGSATDVADKINAAISAAVAAVPPTMTAGAAVAKANGNVVTIENALGDSIAVSAFTSAGNGTASYASISGAGSSLLLNDAAAATTATNSGGGAAATASSILALQTGKDYSFNINGTNISVTDLGTTTTEADLLAQLKLAIGDGGAGSSVAGQNFTLQDATGKNIEIKNFVASSSPAGSAGSMAMTVRVNTSTNTASNTFAVGGSDTSAIGAADVVQLTFSEAEADYGFKIDTEAFTIATATAGKSLQEALAVTRDAINASAASAKVIARVVDGKLEIENKSAAAVTLDTFTSTGKAAVVAGTASFATVDLTAQGSASTTNGTVATPSETTMDFSEDDTYSFKIGGTLVTAEITGGSLDKMVSAVNSQSATTGVSAQISNGDLLLTRAAGGAINITEFASVGTGIANVAHAAGQGSSVTLTDTAAVTGASTAAAGKATATTMALSMDVTDSVTFQLSDGQTNAVVRLASFDITDNAAMLAEINSALTQVGSDIVATAASKTAPIVLTNSKGGEIKLTNYTSDGAGVMTASPGAQQGVGKMLDDSGVAASQMSVSAISILNEAGSQSALDAIDRALESVSSERSSLGAVMNRMDHTINNLTNISTNTSGARGRIEDADFAAESTNLSKAQILQQASTAMLAQANASKQSVLSLLQG